jgi:hypothetical protein
MPNLAILGMICFWTCPGQFDPNFRWLFRPFQGILSALTSPIVDPVQTCRSAVQIWMYNPHVQRKDF